MPVHLWQIFNLQAFDQRLWKLVSMKLPGYKAMDVLQRRQHICTGNELKWRGEWNKALHVSDFWKMLRQPGLKYLQALVNSLLLSSLLSKKN